MRIITTLCCLIAIFTLATSKTQKLRRPNTKYASSRSLLLTVNTDKKSYQLTEDVEVRVRLKNMGQKPITLPASMSPQDYGLRFTVLDDSNEEVPFSGLQPKRFNNNRSVTLEPGYTWGTDFLLSKRSDTLMKQGFYKIVRPGYYKIKCTYFVEKRTTKFGWVGETHSKVVSFRIK